MLVFIIVFPFPFFFGRNKYFLSSCALTWNLRHSSNFLSFSDERHIQKEESEQEQGERAVNALNGGRWGHSLIDQVSGLRTEGSLHGVKSSRTTTDCWCLCARPMMVGKWRMDERTNGSFLIGAWDDFFPLFPSNRWAKRRYVPVRRERQIF